jgi:DNA-binding response OmpR family regulator
MKRILIAEDNKLILETVAMNLTREGYQVFKAEDGRECLKIAREQHIDLIITDVYMPNINGLEVIATLKEEEIKIPVLVLSAAGAEENVLKAFELGADDFMIKPFSLVELNFRVKKLIDKKQ